MAPRRRSTVWNHYQEMKDKKAKCSYCSKVLSIAARSFGNLSRHLKTMHPTVFLSKPVTIHTDELDSAAIIDDPGNYYNFFNYVYRVKFKCLIFVLYL